MNSSTHPLKPQPRPRRLYEYDTWFCWDENKTTILLREGTGKRGSNHNYTYAYIFWDDQHWKVELWREFPGMPSYSRYEFVLSGEFKTLKQAMRFSLTSLRLGMIAVYGYLNRRVR
jgi:hypothetical protein